MMYIHTVLYLFPYSLEGFEREAHTRCRDVQWNTSNDGKRGGGFEIDFFKLVLIFFISPCFG